MPKRLRRLRNVWYMKMQSENYLAVNLSLIHIYQTLIEIDQVKNYPDEQVVLITTGSQGESMAALSRMAANIHKKIVIKPKDVYKRQPHWSE